MGESCSMYTIDFERMEQMNCTTGRVRPVRSVPLQYEWEDDHHKWGMFSEASHAFIGWAHLRGLSSVTVCIKDGVQISVNLLKMQQTSLITGRRRAIRLR